jgi:hypothetical protein
VFAETLKVEWLNGSILNLVGYMQHVVAPHNAGSHRIEVVKMFFRKFNVIVVVAVLLLFGSVSMVQGAPPRQEGGENENNLGETIDLNNDGNVEEEPSVRKNLGTIMSQKGDETDDSMDNPGDTDSTDNTDDVADETAQHPVASAVAEYFGVPYEEIMTIHETGQGFGAIARAYFFGDELGVAPTDLLEAAHGQGWGNVLREYGVHPGAAGLGHKPEHAGGPPAGVNPPGQNKKPDAGSDDDFVSAASESGKSGNGNGNGNNGNGNGHGKGHNK